MDELFGLSMDYIMFALVIMLAISLTTVAYVVLRNRIMFKMGVRNIPRRMAQTVLIVIGLMLSTLIISAALTTGDTVDRSMTNWVYEMAGHLDEIVLFDVEETGGSAAEPFVPESTVAELEAALGDDPDIDGIAPVLFEPVPVINPQTGLSTPSAFLTGADPERMDGFPDIVSLDGEVLDVGALAPDEIYLNESGQEELDAQPGDTLQVFVAGIPATFNVLDIVKDKYITGAITTEEGQSQDGMVTRLDVAQRLFDREGEVDFIGISNRGGVRDGMALSDTVAEKVENALTDYPNLSVETIKQDTVEMAEFIGNVMSTMFLVMGLFSIAAGILLIFMIFVMLAAERKPEMGMARAVGSKRSQLVHAFLSEGMAYNLGAALVGTALGVLVAIGIARVMAGLFAQINIDITPHVTPRSLIIAYCLGVVVTFITVVISSWRVSRLNIVAAIRDLPETSPLNPEQGTWRGYLRGVLNAFVAGGIILVSLIGALTFSGLWPLFLLVALIGLVGPWLYLLRDQSFSAPARQRSGDRPMAWFWPFWFPIPILAFPSYQITLLVARRERVPTWPLLLTPLHYLAALILVRLARDHRPRSVPNWLILVGLLVPPLGLVMVALQDHDRPIAWSAGFGTVGVVAGALLVVTGISNELAFPFMLGLSVALLSSAAVLRYFALPERPVFTFVGLAVLAIWALFSGPLGDLLPEMEGDIEMFFLSGIFMVASATFVIVYNADLLLRFIERAGGWFGRLLPALRIAVAYPLANKFRTGMTLAMIALVVFAVVMMSIMNTNFNALFLRDDSRGGWDIVVTENPNNPVGDLVAALDSEGSVDTEQFAAVGAVSFPDLFVGSELYQPGASDEWERYLVLGVDDAFAGESQIRLQTRARQYPDDEAVWEALRTVPGVAVIDAFAVSEGGFGGAGGPEFHVEDLDETAEVMDPLVLLLRDPASKKTDALTVVGVIDFGSSANFFGLYTSEQTFNSIFGEPEFSRFYVKVQPGVDDSDMAKAIESALVTSGAQAESLKDQVEEQQATFNSFFYLIQGFMGLGLLVGTAAVGVIAFRSVVERRQQIGMLRAIGYTRGTVALSFIMESSFIALLGIATGIGLAVLLSFNLLHSDEFSNLDMGFVIPWWQILLTAAFAFGASFLMTILPSRQAAGITIAEAIRYE